MTKLNLMLNDDQIDALIERLRTLDADTFKGIIDHTARRLAAAMESHVAIYPPARPASTYTRTGELGRSITSDVQREKDKTIAVVGTNKKYAVWVIGKEDPAENERGQSWVHKGRWTPMDKAISNNRDEYRALVIADLEAAVRVYVTGEK